MSSNSSSVVCQAGDNWSAQELRKLFLDGPGGFFCVCLSEGPFLLYGLVKFRGVVFLAFPPPLWCPSLTTHHHPNGETLLPPGGQESLSADRRGQPFSHMLTVCRVTIPVTRRGTAPIHAGIVSCCSRP